MLHQTGDICNSESMVVASSKMKTHEERSKYNDLLETKGNL